MNDKHNKASQHTQELRDAHKEVTDPRIRR